MPSSESNPVRVAQGRHGAAVRWHKANQTDTARDLAAARVEEAIDRILNDAPPLTPAQRDRLAALLRPTVSGAA